MAFSFWAGAPTDKRVRLTVAMRVLPAASGYPRRVRAPEALKLREAVAGLEEAARVAGHRPGAPSEAAAAPAELEERVESAALVAWVWASSEELGQRAVLAVLRAVSSRVLEAVLRPIAPRGPGRQPIAFQPGQKAWRRLPNQWAIR